MRRAKRLLLGALLAAVPARASDTAGLAVFGAVLTPGDGGLIASRPLAGSPAERLGLKAGDTLLFLDRYPVRSREDAAAAWRGWAAGTRLSAVVRRGVSIEALEGPNDPLAPLFSRGPRDYSAQELAFKAERLQDATRLAAARLKAAPALEAALGKRQSFWLRFPRGIPWEAAAGEVLEAETTSGVPASSDLDFLLVGPGSKVWAKVVESKTSLETQQLRLLLFRLRPAGGRDYAIQAVLSELLTPRHAQRLSAGGILVTATAAAGSPRKKKMLDSEALLRAELMEPLTLTEAPSFYKAGPGLWPATEAGGGIVIGAVAAGRSAEKAGLKPGQALLEIDGRSASGRGFTEALSRLYGPAGTAVRVTVLEDGKRRRVDLTRASTAP